ncbi:MAG: D-alanyl-D-alanine carboxypeptidase [Patescibacteria group bacterium]
MRRYSERKKRPSHNFLKFLLFLAIGGLLFNYLRPLPHADASVVPISSQIDSVRLRWPGQGYAALGAQGFGVLATHGSQTPRPMASLAKVITVLAILEKHPLTLGQRGPILTLTADDVALFEKYFGLGGAYVKVEAGEKITEYQALQAILLPSANNMADGLAIWAFGSMDAYVTYANTMLKRLGLSKTIVAADASGFSPATVSTPTDLIRLGELALNNPVVAQIVAQPSATIPVHGIIYSANSRLGYDNVIGIKTGLTDQAGGCFLFAAKYQVEKDKHVTVIGVIMGAATLRAALDESEPLLASAKPYFNVKTPVKAGEPFASLTTSWLAQAQVVARQDVRLVTWRGAILTPRVELSKINGSLPAGAQVGTALISSGNNTVSTPLVLQKAIAGPSWQWRLKRF